MKATAACRLIMIAVFFVGALGCKLIPPPDPNPVLGQMTDARDDQTYQAVTLGGQTWLARDLNYETAGSWCYQDKEHPDPAANCGTYGRLYDWEAAKTACPAGWHLPSDQEWSTLVKYLDPHAVAESTASIVEESKWAGGMLKATGNLRDETGLWNYPNVGATNASGLSALPAGVCYDDGSCDVMGRHAIYWTSTQNDRGKVWFRVLDYGLRSIYRAEEGQWGMTRDTGISVRCIKD